jgi:hypothetical protein
MAVTSMDEVFAITEAQFSQQVRITLAAIKREREFIAETLLTST